MSRGTLYLQTVAGEPLRTRVILIHSLVKHFNLPFKISAPDNVYPSKFSARKVPCMQWADGQLQEESIPIVFALLDQAPQAKLLGDGGVEDKSLILQWMCKFNYDIMVPIATVFMMKAGRMEFNQYVHDDALNKIEANSKYLEDKLAMSDYLVRDKLTVADLYGVCMYYRPLGHFLDAKWRSEHPALMKWWNTCTNNEIFDGFFSSMEMYDK